MIHIWRTIRVTSHSRREDMLRANSLELDGLPIWLLQRCLVSKSVSPSYIIFLQFYIFANQDLPFIRNSLENFQRAFFGKSHSAPLSAPVHGIVFFALQYYLNDKNRPSGFYFELRMKWPTASLWLSIATLSKMCRLRLIFSPTLIQLAYLLPSGMDPMQSITALFLSIQGRGCALTAIDFFLRYTTLLAAVTRLQTVKLMADMRSVFDGAFWTTCTHITAGPSYRYVDGAMEVRLFWPACQPGETRVEREGLQFVQALASIFVSSSCRDGLVRHCRSATFHPPSLLLAFAVSSVPIYKVSLDTAGSGTVAALSSSKGRIHLLHPTRSTAPNEFRDKASNANLIVEPPADQVEGRPRASLRSCSSACRNTTSFRDHNRRVRRQSPRSPKRREKYGLQPEEPLIRISQRATSQRTTRLFSAAQSVDRSCGGQWADRAPARTLYHARGRCNWLPPNARQRKSNLRWKSAGGWSIAGAGRARGNASIFTPQRSHIKSGPWNVSVGLPHALQGYDCRWRCLASSCAEASVDCRVRVCSGRQFHCICQSVTKKYLARFFFSHIFPAGFLQLVGDPIGRCNHFSYCNNSLSGKHRCGGADNETWSSHALELGKRLDFRSGHLESANPDLKLLQMACFFLYPSGNLVGYLMAPLAVVLAIAVAAFSLMPLQTSFTGAVMQHSTTVVASAWVALAAVLLAFHVSAGGGRSCDNIDIKRDRAYYQACATQNESDFHWYLKPRLPPVASPNSPAAKGFDVGGASGGPSDTGATTPHRREFNGREGGSEIQSPVDMRLPTDANLRIERDRRDGSITVWQTAMYSDIDRATCHEDEIDSGFLCREGQDECRDYLATAYPYGNLCSGGPHRSSAVSKLSSVNVHGSTPAGRLPEHPHRANRTAPAVPTYFQDVSHASSSTASVAAPWNAGPVFGGVAEPFGALSPEPHASWTPKGGRHHPPAPHTAGPSSRELRRRPPRTLKRSHTCQSGLGQAAQARRHDWSSSISGHSSSRLDQSSSGGKKSRREIASNSMSLAIAVPDG
eukprot:284816620_6